VRLVEMDNLQESFSKVGAEIIQYCDSMKINISTVNSDGYGFSYYLFAM
jgi:hypothetical protein